MRYKKVWEEREFLFLNILVIFLLSVSVFYANGSIIGPMIQADESSHLLNAAAIAGYYNDFASSYHAGYSLLISPAFLFANGPEQAWLIVRIINVLLYMMGVLFMFLFAQRTYVGKLRVMPLAAVLVVAVYPMWVIMAGYAFAQIAFFAVYAALAYLVLLALKGSVLFWLFSGLMAGFLYWVHPTGLAVAIALCLSATYESVVKKKPSILLLPLISATLMVVSYKYMFVPWLHDRMTISGVTPSFHYPSLTDVLKSLLSLDEMIEFISRVAGHLFYITIGTVGLVWAYFISNFYGKHSTPVSIPNSSVIFLSLSLVGVLTLSVLLFNSTPEATRLDHWMYGRYVEGVIAPLIIIGAISINPKTQCVSIIIAMLSSLVLMSGFTEYTHTARMNVSAFWQDFYLRDAGLAVWSLSGIGIILVSLIISHFSRLTALIFIASVFVWMSYLQLDWHFRAAKAADNRSDLARIVRLHYPVGSCVGFDHDGINSYNRHVHWFDYGFVLYDYPLQRLSTSDWMKHCDGPLFSYDEHLDESIGVYRIGKSTTGGPTLWAKYQVPFIGTYPFIVQERSSDISRLFESGWHQMESGHIWSAAKGVLKLPVPNECKMSFSCEAVISFSVFGASPQRQTKIIFSTIQQNEKIMFDKVIKDAGMHRFAIPLTSEDDYQVAKVDIPNATSPSLLNGSNDERVLGIAISKIELNKVSRK